MNARCTVLTAVLLKIQVSWHVALCCWVSSYQLSEVSRCLLNIRNDSNNDTPQNNSTFIMTANKNINLMYLLQLGWFLILQL